MKQDNTSGMGRAAFVIAKEGYPFIFAPAFTTVVLVVLGLTLPALLFAVLTLFVCFFFRDPDRTAPPDPDAIVSPADGRVIIAGERVKDPFDDKETLKISIFMSIFNVHVNRIPFDGRVEDILYHPGKFFSANLDKASVENEHNAVKITAEKNRSLWVVQIAGLVARRIICTIKKAEMVHKGARFGLICFGSRLDLYLPADTEIKISKGQKARAGETILGYMP
jgi:phosphatidylserine decarboxylase